MEAASARATAPFLTNVENHFGRVTLLPPDNMRRTRAKERRTGAKVARVHPNASGRTRPAARDALVVQSRSHSPTRVRSRASRSSASAPRSARAAAHAQRATRLSLSDGPSLLPTQMSGTRRVSRTDRSRARADATSSTPSAAETSAQHLRARLVNVWDEVNELPGMDGGMLDVPPPFEPSSDPERPALVQDGSEHGAEPAYAPPQIPNSPPPIYNSAEDDTTAGDLSVSGDESVSFDESIDAFTLHERAAWEADRIAGLSVLTRVRRSNERREAYIASIAAAALAENEDFIQAEAINAEDNGAIPATHIPAEDNPQEDVPPIPGSFSETRPSPAEHVLPAPQRASELRHESPQASVIRQTPAAEMHGTTLHANVGSHRIGTLVQGESPGAARSMPSRVQPQHGAVARPTYPRAAPALRDAMLSRPSLASQRGSSPVTEAPARSTVSPQLVSRSLSNASSVASASTTNTRPEDIQADDSDVERHANGRAATALERYEAEMRRIARLPRSHAQDSRVSRPLRFTDLSKIIPKAPPPQIPPSPQASDEESDDSAAESAVSSSASGTGTGSWSESDTQSELDRSSETARSSNSTISVDYETSDEDEARAHARNEQTRAQPHTLAREESVGLLDMAEYARGAEFNVAMRSPDRMGETLRTSTAVEYSSDTEESPASQARSSAQEPLSAAPQTADVDVHSAREQLDDMSIVDEQQSRTTVTPLISDRLASLEAMLLSMNPLPPTQPENRGNQDTNPFRNRSSNPFRNQMSSFANIHSMTAPLPTQTRLPTITDDTRHFPPSHPIPRERNLQGSAASMVSAPEAVSAELPIALPGESPSSQVTRDVIDQSEDIRPVQMSPVPAQDRPSQSRASTASVTDLDMLVSQLDDPATNYERAVALSEFLGEGAHDAPLSAQSLQNIPVGRVEVDSRRVSRSGRLKQKLSVVGVRVDRCGICLAQFREGQMVCILPCIHLCVQPIELS